MLNDVKVIICGKEYKVKTAESPNYVYSLARALESKINELMNSGSGSSPYTASSTISVTRLRNMLTKPARHALNVTLPLRR